MMNLRTRSCQEAWEHMSKICANKPVRNFFQQLDMSDFVVETNLFPISALTAYSAWNIGKNLAEDQYHHMNDLRGGSQGDYREGMWQKIDNVVECLTNFPKSKRGVISVCNNSMAVHTDDENAKCLRELHLYMDDNNKLSATILMRAQAAALFPKNIHFIGSIMEEVAKRLPKNPALGTAFYLATILVADRS